MKAARREAIKKAEKGERITLTVAKRLILKSKRKRNQKAVYSLDQLSLSVPREYPLRPKTISLERPDTNVWFIPIETTQGMEDKGHHPAVFPSELPLRCIKLHGVEQTNLVLDPFSGIGSTLVACQKLGVPGLGVEIDPSYVRFAQKRLQTTRVA